MMLLTLIPMLAQAFPPEDDYPCWHFSTILQQVMGLLEGALGFNPTHHEEVSRFVRLLLSEMYGNGAYDCAKFVRWLKSMLAFFNFDMATFDVVYLSTVGQFYDKVVLSEMRRTVIDLNKATVDIQAYMESAHVLLDEQIMFAENFFGANRISKNRYRTGIYRMLFCYNSATLIEKFWRFMSKEDTDEVFLGKYTRKVFHCCQCLLFLTFRIRHSRSRGVSQHYSKGHLGVVHILVARHLQPVDGRRRQARGKCLRRMFRKSTKLINL